MNVLWPWFLLLLLLIPLFVAGYIWMLRRKRKFTVRYSSLSLIRAAQPERSRWRRHLPFALFLLALTAITTAMARPVAQVTVPLSRTTIILAIDTSRSMCATDVEPNRLTVAQDAALAFVAEQPADTRIGIVAFAGFAEIVVPPTADKDELQAAIRSFSTSLGTAIGSAQLKAIDAIAEVNPDVDFSGVDLSANRVEGDAVDDAMAAQQMGYQPDIIVLLTDGANSGGPHPLDAAQQAADRRVRVYTIGFGTDNPGQMICNRQQAGSDIFGGGFGGGFGFGGGGGNLRRFLIIDEETLQTIAEMTGGTYFRAENADQLLEIFQDLPTQIVLQQENIELSAIFSLLGALIGVVAVTLSLRWNRLL
ncbi:MAG: VWA domain-containing protein [Caldilineaceae bacterium]|nr:VWA domain-containing protein [Caldilineaceae bacterium]MCB0185991.1 VWA domain-containing protein [Caldilineaceae bacterium]